MDWLNLIDFAELLDILLMSLLIYTVLIWIKETRAAFVLIGIALLAGVYLFALQFNMTLTTTVFHGFFTVIIIAVIVIFQEEIRSFFERIAVWFLNYRIHYKKAVTEVIHPEAAVLVRTLFDLARGNIGALLVLHGKDFLGRHLEGGTELNGKISEALIKSIFDAHSPGHDGAVVIDNGQLKSFAVHLPLSKNILELGQRGTRHAAALGLSERADALCCVVSEERGEVSVARKGKIESVANPARLEVILVDFYNEINPLPVDKPWQRFYHSHYREKITALLSAFLLWFVLVHGAEIVYTTYSLPVEFHHLGRKLTVQKAQPKKVHITFSGPRRNFFLLGRNRIRVALDASSWETGTYQRPVSFNDVTFPNGVVVRYIEPENIEVSVSRKDQKP